MRITNLDNVTKLYQTNNKGQVAKQDRVEKKDRLEISKEARDYQLGLEKLGAVPELRQDKIDFIKQEIQNGTYQLDPERIADKILKSASLIEKYNEW